MQNRQGMTFLHGAQWTDNNADHLTVTLGNWHLCFDTEEDALTLSDAIVAMVQERREQALNAMEPALTDEDERIMQEMAEDAAIDRWVDHRDYES